MKQLSIEEKAKRYDEAIERAKKQLNGAKVFDYDNEQVAHNIRTTVYNMFPELAESEDERIRKQIISFLKEFEYDHYRSLDFSSWIAWLEKQGNNADKVEPKFKAGDWVVFDNKHQSIYQVEKIEGGYYILRHTYGGTLRVCVLHDKDLRLWTIEDAKEGDVLAGKIDGDSYILIYKQIKDGWIETYGHYYDSVDRFCIPSQLFCKEVKGTFCPATKEQRDTLEKAMLKAGYKWNADKKELIKL